MNLSDFFAEIRNPETRGKALRSLVAAIALASVSISGTIAGTQGATGFYQVIIERAQFPMIRAEIESLRLDAAGAPCDTNAQLRSSVAEVNKRIEHEHESNRHWFSDWASTDYWNTVERIQFRDCSAKTNLEGFYPEPPALQFRPKTRRN
jgi:hypothetical protein